MSADCIIMKPFGVTFFLIKALYYSLLTRNAADDATDDVAQATPRNYAARTSNLNSE
ncbi:hypothetical protein HK096_005054, partial [Nowakowskiella sp. JEL0078]